MELIDLLPRPEIQQTPKLYTRYTQLIKLLEELKQKDIPEEVAITINSNIDDINKFEGPDNSLLKFLRVKQYALINLLARKSKIVTKGYYQNKWMLLGMAGFGIPFGTVFSTSLDNFAFLGVGLPIGMAMGIGIGASLDRKAKEEGRQLQVVLK